MIFHFHSEQYLTWFTPALILIAALYSPLLNRKGAPLVIAAILIAFVLKQRIPTRLLVSRCAREAPSPLHRCFRITVRSIEPPIFTSWESTTNSTARPSAASRALWLDRSNGHSSA